MKQPSFFNVINSRGPILIDPSGDDQKGYYDEDGNWVPDPSGDDTLDPSNDDYLTDPPKFQHVIFDRVELVVAGVTINTVCNDRIETTLPDFNGTWILDMDTTGGGALCRTLTALLLTGGSSKTWSGPGCGGTLLSNSAIPLYAVIGLREQGVDDVNIGYYRGFVFAYNDPGNNNKHGCWGEELARTEQPYAPLLFTTGGTVKVTPLPLL